MKTTWFGRDIKPMSNAYTSLSAFPRSFQIRGSLTSMAIETTIRVALKETRGLYFIKPCWSNSLFWTVLKKYQLRPASTSKMSTLDMRSQ